MMFDGAYWFECNLTPENDSQNIQTYQYDLAHKDDVIFKINNWGDVIFTEGKLSALQSKTNNYILSLTAITVWEAVFGIGDTLKFMALITSKVFSLLSGIFGFLSNVS